LAGDPSAFGGSQLIGDALFCDKGLEMVVHLSSWKAGRSMRRNDRRGDADSHRRNRRSVPRSAIRRRPPCRVRPRRAMVGAGVGVRVGRAQRHSDRAR
jgi:hypothetical protein